MDKKNTTIGLLLLMAAFTLMVFMQQQQPPPAPPPPAQPSEAVERRPSPVTPIPGEATPGEAVPMAPATAVEESFVTLENEYFRVEFTNIGGAVRRVELKNYAKTKGSEERFVINELGETPVLALVDMPGADADTGFELVESSSTEVIYRARIGDSLDVTRRYWIENGAGPHDPAAYLVHHETTFANLTGQDLLLREFGLDLGTASPTDRQMLGIEHLNFNYFDGNKFKLLSPRRFSGGGFMSWIGLRSGAPVPYIQERMSLQWASVKNQFFTSIYTPDQETVGFWAKSVDMPLVEEETRPRQGMTGKILFDLRGVSAGEKQLLTGHLYAGPKEYRRLEALDRQQDRVMQFGWAPIAFISKLLLSFMVLLYSMIPNYGVAIILMTVIIKVVLWPLTAQAARSSKRMAKIREPMQALREKYKEDPRKMQAETMKLFRENKVNPMGGCLPIFVQIPIFFALFRMIMSASELRFSSFLWVADLSAPDTIGHIAGFPINILPLFMGISMFYQMRMMPMAMDPAQQKIFKLMPFIFLAFSYTFSSGLVLYWTVQNLMTILQQYLTNRQKDDLPLAASGNAKEKGGKPVDVHVSPYIKKKKKKKEEGR